MKSLRVRAVVGGILSAVVIIVLGFTGLSSFADDQAEEGFSELLHQRHEMVLSVVETYRNSLEIADRRMGDRMFERPFSGQYWQITAPDGDVLASPSLREMRLPLSDATSDGRSSHVQRMPDGQTVRVLGQWLRFDDGETWHVQVASSLQDMKEDQTLFRRSLLLAFGVVTFIGVTGALLQITLVLRPLNALRRDVLSRWQNEDGLNVADYPTEVVPLVTDINTLLERNHEMSRRSRRQAADLAHAIKTPSAIIRNELESLLRDGQQVQLSIDALDRLDAQLDRSFARMRTDVGQDEMHVFIDLSAALDRIVRAFGALANNAEKTLASDIAPNLRVRIDQSDFDEIIGNLLDNALKWAATRICVTARQEDDLILISVTDDGDGIPDADMASVTQSGHRLDTAKPGTGLGLAIVKDLAHAYGGSLGLERSAKKGGLCATISLKAPRSRRSR